MFGLLKFCGAPSKYCPFFCSGGFTPPFFWRRKAASAHAREPGGLSMLARDVPTEFEIVHGKFNAATGVVNAML